SAKGDVIMCMGAHAHYPADYVRKCVQYLETFQADNVGGIIRTLPQSASVVSVAIACFMSHRLGAGTATFRSGTSEPRWVDTVFGGCYRRAVFERIGKLNEMLIKSQDREFNQRLRNAGGRILCVPEIQCTYYARGNMREFARHI